MRLYDTYSRSLVELPAPPGPVGMQFCGPTVYGRAHIGDARPFVIGMWLRSWLARPGTAERAQRHRRQRQDLRRGAERSAELAERATAWYLEDVGDSARDTRLPAKVTEHIGIVHFIEQLVERACLPGRG